MAGGVSRVPVSADMGVVVWLSLAALDLEWPIESSQSWVG